LICHVSREDPRLQPYRHVGEPAWLALHGLFVAEGRLVVDRLIERSGEHGGFVVESVLVTPTALRALEPRLDPAWTVLVAEPAVVDGITGFKFHRGCLALVRRPSPPLPLTAFARARRLVLLEGVGNPDNIGGIFRSAAALGAEGVLLDPTCADPFYRKAVRTSMGAVLWLPSSQLDPWLAGLAALRDRGLTIAALSPTGDSTVDEFAATLSPDARLALLAGSEGSGLTAGAVAAADVTVRIPVDPRSDSLNVAVAVSIALYRLALHGVAGS
jgi:tRNA G18 (ribose-2'-O)-methylase SpoU